MYLYVTCILSSAMNPLCPPFSLPQGRGGGCGDGAGSGLIPRDVSVSSRLGLLFTPQVKQPIQAWLYPASDTEVRGSPQYGNALL